MNFRDLQLLKEIALLGGVEGYVSVRSRELGRRIGCSQQQASRNILNLLSLGLIERSPRKTDQSLKLSEEGKSLLFKEYLDLVRVFEARERLTVTGMVVSGYGEGKFFVGLPAYREQIKRMYGIEAFPGTLNIEVAVKDRPKLKLLEESPSGRLEGFSDAGRDYGPVRCYRASLQGHSGCLIVRPEVGGHDDALEIVASEKLRDVLELTEDMWVTVEIEV